MKKLLETIEDMWVTAAFAEHGALPADNRAGFETDAALIDLRSAIH